MTPAILLCLVVGVTDGDTLTVRCGESPQERVRLAEIDAPERRQPFGTKAKQALSELAYGAEATVRVSSRDRYGRLIAHVVVDGRDVGWTMVEQGMAWCYEGYVKDSTCHLRQDRARATKVGLWADPEPTPPWKWRRRGASSVQSHPGPTAATHFKHEPQK